MSNLLTMPAEVIEDDDSPTKSFGVPKPPSDVVLEAALGEDGWVVLLVNVMNVHDYANEDWRVVDVRPVIMQPIVFQYASDILSRTVYTDVKIHRLSSEANVQYFKDLADHELVAEIGKEMYGGS